MAKRREEEFYCDKDGGGCGKYFKTYLYSTDFGDVTIECPNEDCKHQHYRTVADGIVTKDRHSMRNGKIPVIMGLPSTLSDTPWHNDPTFRKSQLKAYNGGISHA